MNIVNLHTAMCWKSNSAANMDELSKIFVVLNSGIDSKIVEEFKQLAFNNLTGDIVRLTFTWTKLRAGNESVFSGMSLIPMNVSIPVVEDSLLISEEYFSELLKESTACDQVNSIDPDISVPGMDVSLLTEISKSLVVARTEFFKRVGGDDQYITTAYIYPVSGIAKTPNGLEEFSFLDPLPQEKENEND